MTTCGRITDLLGTLARSREMSLVACDKNRARKASTDPLDAGKSPKFAAVPKVLSSFGLDLEARKASSDKDR